MLRLLSADTCLDITAIWFCMQCLGRMDDFLEYYQSNRRLQLNSDLSPPSNFIESYQKFIAQACCIIMVLARGAWSALLPAGMSLTMRKRCSGGGVLHR